MMSKLKAQAVVRIHHLSQRFIKVKGEDNVEIIIMIKMDIKIDTDQAMEIVRMSYKGRAWYGQNYRGRLQYDQNYRSDLRRGNFRGMQIYRGQNFGGGYRGSFRNDNFGRGRSRSRESQYSGNFRRNEQSSSRSRSGSRTCTNRGLDVLNVGSMIILPKTVQIYHIQRKKGHSRCSKCSIWKKATQH